MKIRKSYEIGIPRKVSWKEHCSDPKFKFGIFLFLAFAVVSVIGGYEMHQVKEGFLAALIFLIAIVWFAVITKISNDKGQLLNSYEAELMDMVDDIETYDLYAEIIHKEN